MLSTVLSIIYILALVILCFLHIKEIKRVNKVVKKYDEALINIHHATNLLLGILGVEEYKEQEEN